MDEKFAYRKTRRCRNGSLKKNPLCFVRQGRIKKQKGKGEKLRSCNIYIYI
jgi:hypothetical protein